MESKEKLPGKSPVWCHSITHEVIQKNLLGPSLLNASTVLHEEITLPDMEEMGLVFSDYEVYDSCLLFEISK